MSISTTTNNNNQKVTYQLWTDGKGSFSVKIDEEDSQFEFSDSAKQQNYSKLIDSKIFSKSFYYAHIRN